MYFEPTKKTYYRFPSSNSINNFDSRYYFPDKPHAAGEDTHYEDNVNNSAASHEHHYSA